ncbi:hypothetical protein FRC08_004789, partial [Ceratobasidium sp. 394]
MSTPLLTVPPALVSARACRVSIHPPPCSPTCPPRLLAYSLPPRVAGANLSLHVAVNA